VTNSNHKVIRWNLNPTGASIPNGDWLISESAVVDDVTIAIENLKPLLLHQNSRTDGQRAQKSGQSRSSELSDRLRHPA
jgi:hypothetical protein